MRVWRKLIVSILPLSILVLSGCGSINEYERAGGDSIGKKCSQVAFTVDRFKLHYSAGDYIYSLFFDDESKPDKSSLKHKVVSFIGDGNPDTTEISTDVYVFNVKAKKLEKIITIFPPEEWKNNAVSYSTKSRILPSGVVLLTMRGCEKTIEECSKSKFFKIEDGKSMEISDLPRYKKKEIKEQSICASNTTYNVNDATISYGSVKTGSWIEIATVNNGEVKLK